MGFEGHMSKYWRDRGLSARAADVLSNLGVWDEGNLAAMSGFNYGAVSADFRLSGRERVRRHRALKKAACRWQLHIRPETLPQKAGCNPRQIGCAVLKDVVDNGLDFVAALEIERIPVHPRPGAFMPYICRTSQIEMTNYCLSY
jgi:hypothetical protein